MVSYMAQSELVIDMLPIVDRHKEFALKGGTAINYFYLNMPRFSVDIDLCYLPITDRMSSLTDISDGLQKIKKQIETTYPAIRILAKSAEKGYTTSLFIQRVNINIKIEPNLVIRGSVFPPERRSLAVKVAEEMGKSSKMTILSLADVYGGKICAALDRQHPRDLFDIKLLLENEGITEQIRQAFVVYLVSHSRPMAELLAPNRLDIETVFNNEFSGMARIPIRLSELLDAREQLIDQLNNTLTQDERAFILSLKKGEPLWNLFPIKGIEYLPAVQWKLQNIRKMPVQKHQAAVEKLKNVLKL